MPTTDRFTNFKEHKLLTKKDIDNWFFQNINEKIHQLTVTKLMGVSYTLGSNKIELTSTSNDTFTLNITNADKGADADGHIIDVSLLPLNNFQLYPFENTNTTVYYVGIKHCTAPSGIEQNLNLTDIYEYSNYSDTIGEQGNPDSVAVVGGTVLRLVIDGILENGVDHSDCPIAVWLDYPVTNNAAAIHTGVITYDAGSGENRIDIPYGTLGPLGQPSPSLTVTNYNVHVRGVSWFKNTDISTDNDYIYIGTVTGSGAGTTPTVFDTSGQRLTNPSNVYSDVSTGINNTTAGERFLVVPPAVGLRFPFVQSYAQQGPAGAYPISALCTDCKYLYYAQDIGSNLQVGNLDPITGTPPSTGSWSLYCGSACLALDCDGAYVYVGSTGINAIRRIDSGGVHTDWTAHGASAVTSIACQGTHVACADIASPNLVRIYQQDGTFVGSYDTTFPIIALASHGDFCYSLSVSGTNYRVCKVKFATLASQWATTYVTSAPITAAIARCDGRRLYVAHDRVTIGGILRTISIYSVHNGEINTVTGVASLNSGLHVDVDMFSASSGTATQPYDKATMELVSRWTTIDVVAHGGDGISVFGHIGNNIYRYWLNRPAIEYQRVSGTDPSRFPWPGALAIPTGRNL